MKRRYIYVKMHRRFIHAATFLSTLNGRLKLFPLQRVYKRSLVLLDRVLQLLISKHDPLPAVLSRWLQIVWMFCDVNAERFWASAITGLDWTYCRLPQQLNGSTVTRRRTETGETVNRIKRIPDASSSGTTSSKTIRAFASFITLARKPQVA